MNQITATAPLRIDIGGGVTDIPLFGKSVGTSIANIAVTIFQDQNLENEQKISADAHFNDKDTDELIINSKAVNLHAHDEKYAYIHNLFSYVKNSLKTDQKITLEITNSLPTGTGLGASASLTVSIFACLTSLRSKEATLDIPDILQKAHHFETNVQGVAGGFQDYVAACYGGYNYIDFSSLRDNLYDNQNLGQTLPRELCEFLNTSMVFIVKQSSNVSSDNIVEDELQQFRSETDASKERLIAIKKSNEEIHTLLHSKKPVLYIKDHLIAAIDRSWKAQKELSPMLMADSLRDLEQHLRPFSYTLRGPGAANNSLLLFALPDKKTEILDIVQRQQESYAVLFPKISNQGLTVLQS